MIRDLLENWAPALFGSAVVLGASAALAISPEDQASLRKDCIRPYVWGGFETRDGVYEAAPGMIKLLTNGDHTVTASVACTSGTLKVAGGTRYLPQAPRQPVLAESLLPMT